MNSLLSLYFINDSMMDICQQHGQTLWSSTSLGFTIGERYNGSLSVFSSKSSHSFSAVKRLSWKSSRKWCMISWNTVSNLSPTVNPLVSVMEYCQQSIIYSEPIGVSQQEFLSLYFYRGICWIPLSMGDVKILMKQHAPPCNWGKCKLV